MVLGDSGADLLGVNSDRVWNRAEPRSFSVLFGCGCYFNVPSYIWTCSLFVCIKQNCDSGLSLLKLGHKVLFALLMILFIGRYLED